METTNPSNGKPELTKDEVLANMMIDICFDTYLPRKDFDLNPDPQMMELHETYDKHEYMAVRGPSGRYIFCCLGCGDICLVGLYDTKYGAIHKSFVEEYVQTRVVLYGKTEAQARLEVAKFMEARDTMIKAMEKHSETPTED
jgi:hypothetical protein